MDLKLFGCGCIALTSISFLILDYLSFEPAFKPAVAVTQISAAERSDTPVRTTSIHASPEGSSQSTLNHYPYPSFSGFLYPDGFARPNWNYQIGGLDISTTPLATQRFVVMLDPGHGGSDPGAQSHNGLVEKHLTLDIAQRTRLYLSKYPNIEVVFTRETDQGLSRNSRVQKIRDSNADLLISLHFNDLPQTGLALVETYFAGSSNINESLAMQHTNAYVENRAGRASIQQRPDDFSFTHSSQQLATILQQHIYTEVRSSNSNAEDAGIKKDTLFVLTRSYKPSALIEISCLSNPLEAARLVTNEYRNRLSSALADGILEYRQSTINSRLINPGQIGRSRGLVQHLPASKENKTG